MRQSLEISNVFRSLTLKQFPLKTKTFFKKLENCILVESATIEKTTFPYRTTLSKVDVKTKRMGITKLIHHK